MILRNTGNVQAGTAARPLLYIRYMNKVLAIALSLPFAACTVGGSSPAGGDDVTTDPGGSTDAGGITPTGISGAIADGTHWTGPVAVTGAVTIAAGVTLTVDPGAVVSMAPSASITISGTMNVAGTKATPATLGPATAAGHWSGVDLKAGGKLTMTYGTQTGGGIYTDGGSAIISDSKLSNANGDYLVMNGGSIDVSYSNIGEETAADSTHCNLHFNTATSIKFTHNNNLNAPYGLMFYGGTGADFTHNNWISSKAGGDVDIEPNPGGTGDFSNSYFSNGQPPGTTGLQFNTLSATRLTDVGPR